MGHRMQTLPHWKPAVIAAMLVSVCLGLAMPSAAAAEPEAMRAVWAGRQGNGFDLFASRFAHGVWSKADHIVTGPGDDITPAMGVDRAGRTWLLWIARDQEGRSTLRYQVGGTEAPTLSGAIDSGHEYNYAPSLLIDRGDGAWATWSSLDDEDEDIFASRFDGKTWSTPVRVNTNDATPDIKPILALDGDGAVLVFWESLEADGYERFQARWDGARFGQEQLVQDRDWIARHTRHINRAAIRLPGGATAFGMAALVFPAADGIQSVPLSILQSMEQQPAQPGTQR